MTTTNWYAWHADYDELTSASGVRLAAVQAQIIAFLDQAPAGPIKVISLAAGQSRELIPLLITHPRGSDVQARLVELDPRNADIAEGALLSAQLADVDVLVADAGLVDSFVGAVPADLVLASGLFAMLSPAEVATTVAGLSQLCAPGATVIWSDDLDQAVLADLFRTAGFAPTVTGGGAGSARLLAAPAPFEPGTRLFS